MTRFRPFHLILPLLFVLLSLPLALLPPQGAVASAATIPEVIHPHSAKFLVSNGTHLFAGRSSSPEFGCLQPLTLIWRMNLDGSNPVPLLEGCHLLLKAMAADALHVYYVSNQSIHRVSVSGGTSQTVVIDQANTSVALDDQYIYWGDNQTSSITIYRQHKNTSVQEELLTLPDPLQMRVRDLAVDDSHVYWVMGNLGVGEVRRMPKAGGASQVLADTADGLNFPRAISLDANHVYWSEDYAAQVRRVAKSGGPVTTYTPDGVDEEGDVSGVGVGNSHIFWWWDGWGAGPGRIRRADKSGGPIEDVALDVDYYGTAVMTEAGHVYWSQIDVGIVRLPLDATPVSIDLLVDDLEVTQALQNLTGAPVPLVGGKDTYVRAFPRADYPFIENVTAVLRAFAPGNVLLGEVEPLNPSLLVGLEWERRLLDDAFNFRLPESWVQSGPVELCVEINPGQPIAELDLSNNEVCENVIFRAKTPDCLVLAPVDVTGTTFLPTPNETDGATIEMLRNWWPAPVQYRGGPTVDWYDNPFNLPEDGTRLLNLFEFMLGHSHMPADFCAGGTIHMAGVVHESAHTDGKFGRARRPGSALWYKRYEGFPVVLSQQQIDLYKQRYGFSVPIISWPFAPHILAHELGHNHGRQHIDCGNPDNVDDGYIYSPCNFTASPPAPQAVYGFFPRSLGDASLTRDWSIVDETDLVRPMMSYGDPSWLSDYTYRPIFNAIPDALYPLSEPQTAPGEMALASLLVEPGLGDIDGAYRMPEALFGAGRLDDLYARHLALLDPDGEYRLELLGAGGTLLASYRFQINPDADGDGAGGLVFPFPTESGWVTLNFYGPGGFLDAQPVSANAPTVTVLSPNGGESVGDEWTIEWEATDADGDELTFTIQYSHDGGQSWQVIAPAVSATEPISDVIMYPWPADEVPGSVGSSLVRVIANDGANRGWDQSDRPFSLDPKHPTVAIVDPGDDDMLAHGKTLIFTGWAYDAEDGELEGSALSWRLDGQPIGTGRKVSIGGLAPGEHFLNLKATDSDGMEAEDRVRFFVSGGSCPLFNREVDILFVVDSSSQMNDMVAVEQAIGDAANWLQDAGMDVVSENYCVAAGSCTGLVVADVHPGTAVDHPSDWGAGVVSLAAHYSWRENSTRIIVPISNQALEDGDPLEDPGADRETLETAVAAANAHGVSVAPLMLPGPNGQGPSVPLQALAHELATSTGGVPADDPGGLGPLLHDIKSNIGCQPRVRDVSVPAYIAENGEPGRIFVRGDNLWPGTQFWLGEQPLLLGEERIYGAGLSLLLSEPLSAGCHDLVFSRPGVAERTMSCAVNVGDAAYSLYLPVAVGAR